MVQLIVGKKGKGKTKQLLDKVNSEVKEISGSVVYLDKSTKHMFELNNKVRLIDVREFMVENCSEFMGFLCGIISQDRDLEKMYLDSFLTISGLGDDSDILPAVEKLDIFSGALFLGDKSGGRPPCLHGRASDGQRTAGSHAAGCPVRRSVDWLEKMEKSDSTESR